MDGAGGGIWQRLGGLAKAERLLFADAFGGAEGVGSEFFADLFSALLVDGNGGFAAVEGDGEHTAGDEYGQQKEQDFRAPLRCCYLLNRRR